MTMCNYDFEILQYNEFENLTRDLLQAEFGIYIESFKDGKDGGIDFRFGMTKDSECIIQVKRYKSVSSLMSQLKKEVEKVRLLNPKRYILSTSVPLSPANKDAIMTMFAPYIIDTKDIFGRGDLNNLLGKHPEVEKIYYKLWLASTNVLQDLIHKDVRNWSDFELETIREEIKTYVVNDSFYMAMNILKEYGYVIISGIPGIGKTTLARMLAYDILAHGFNEFVCIENNLRDGARLFQEGKTQVFFFDDFLGSNTFFYGEKDFENKLISFIKAVQRSKGKLFIMTTREYILAQANEYYEKFKIHQVDIAKCTLDLTAYSQTIKAKILYNHIAEAHLPIEYIEQLIKNKNYLKLVNHTYFNPRVIEMYIDRGEWRKDSPKDFIPSFLRMFNKPTCVWEKAFKALPKEAKYALLVLGSMGGDVHEEDWHTAFQYFCHTSEKELHIHCSDDEWREVIRVLEDCFIRTNRTKVNNLVIIKLYNPSVLGFIVEYVRNNKDVQTQLLLGARFVEQLYSIFTTIPFMVNIGDAFVLLSPELEKISYERLMKIMTSEEQKICSLDNYSQENHLDKDTAYILYKYTRAYGRKVDSIQGLLTKEDLLKEDASLTARLYFLKGIDWSSMQNDRDEIITAIRKEDKEIKDHLAFIETIHAIHGDDLFLEKEFIKEINDKIEEEIDENLSSTDDTQSLADIVERLAEILPEESFQKDEWLQRIEEEEERILCDVPDFDWDERTVSEQELNEQFMQELMTSLRVHEEI